MPGINRFRAGAIFLLAIFYGFIASSSTVLRADDTPSDPVAAAAAAAKEETQAERDARMKWWREARFGMFIHWGIYSVPAGTYHGKQIPPIGDCIQNFPPIP